MLKPFAKSVLMPLGLTEAASEADESIHKKVFGSGRPSDLALHTTSLTISNEYEDIMKKVNSLEGSGLLIKEISKTIKS